MLVLRGQERPSNRFIDFRLVLCWSLRGAFYSHLTTLRNLILVWRFGWRRRIVFHREWLKRTAVELVLSWAPIWLGWVEVPSKGQGLLLYALIPSFTLVFGFGRGYKYCLSSCPRIYLPTLRGTTLDHLIT